MMNVYARCAENPRNPHTYAYVHKGTTFFASFSCISMHVKTNFSPSSRLLKLLRLWLFIAGRDAGNGWNAYGFDDKHGAYMSEKKGKRRKKNYSKEEKFPCNRKLVDVYIYICV